MNTVSKTLRDKVKISSKRRSSLDVSENETIRFVRPRYEDNEDFLRPKGSKRYALSLEGNIFFKKGKELAESHWTPGAGDIEMGKEKEDFRVISKDNPGAKKLILNVLGYFAVADGIIGENISVNFGEEIGHPDAKFFLSIQEGNEAVHAWQYLLLITTYVKDLEEKEMLLNSMETMPAVKSKAAWAKRWTNRNIPLPERLVACSAIEGIHFITSFAVIFWLRDQFPGKLPGLTKSNEWISRDENLHVDFAISFILSLPVTVPLEIVEEIYSDALEEELSFVESIYPKEGVVGLSLEALKEHVKYMANHWFSFFQDPNSSNGIRLLATNSDGSKPRCTNSFGKASRVSKISFFEAKNHEYSKGNVDNQRLAMEEDF